MTAIFLNSPKYGRMETLISTHDLARVQEFPGNWGVVWDASVGSFYASGNWPTANGKYKTVRMHRWILRIDDSKLHVDHVCHDTLDNCRWALNIVTCKENQQNRRKRINNTSGFIGVTWSKKCEKWHARITIGGRRINIGYFTEKSDALFARKQAEVEYHAYKSKLG